MQTPINLLNPCSCGKQHTSDVRVFLDLNLLESIPKILKQYGATKVFMISDKNTFSVAGNKICTNLEKEGLAYYSYIFTGDQLEVDSTAVGEAILNYEHDCDLILAVGTGTLNDIGKILAHSLDLTYIVVATAPSMDGFASGTSSVILNGTKATLESSTPVAIVADLNVLCNAPNELILAGIGDILAKYISIAEWRISNLVTGEYYCEQVASLVRQSVALCVSNIEGIKQRKPESIKILFESLVLSGIAMSYAGLSRPASGMEHYFSHLWDMRAVEFNKKKCLHGIQCGFSTLLSVHIYDLIRNVVPDRKIASNYVATFDVNAWHDELRLFLGSSAEALIEKEKGEKKYDKEQHSIRYELIAQNWNEILRIIAEEIPEARDLSVLFDQMDFPSVPEQMDLDTDVIKMTFLATKDIRDKYIASRLVWDLGIIDQIAKDFQKDYK